MLVEWLDIQSACSLLQRSYRSVVRYVQMGKLQARKVPNPNGGRGGFRYQILLPSLPPEAQQRYWQIVRESRQVEEARPKRGRPRKVREVEAQEEEAQANALYQEAPDWKKEVADERLYVVQATMQLGRRELGQWLAAQGCSYSVGTVYRWRAAYLQSGKNGLLPGWGEKAGNSILPDDVYSVFREVYCAQGQVSAQAAYLAAIGYLKEHYQVGKLPSVQTFLHRLRREENESTIYFLRHGQAAWNRKYGQAIRRDYSKLRCGECVFSDHMQLDLLVSLPDGSTCRPWLTAWSDFKSRKILGWDLHAAAPNSDHIFSSFRAMVANYGLPRAIYIDNGKDYRCRDFAGGRTKVLVDEKKTSTLMHDLGVEVHYALPYNAQSKNIERRFRDFHNYFERFLVGYTGSTIPQRPEALKAQIKGGKLLALKELEGLVNEFITQVLNKLPFGRGAIFANHCPDELWQAENPVLRRASAASLALFCQRSTRLVKVGRNGVKDPDLGLTYWAEEFTGLKGRQVYLRRDLKDYATAWVYSAKDELLCQAQLVDAIHPLAEDERSRQALKEATARKRREEKALRKRQSQQLLDSPEKQRLLKLGVAALNEARGWQEAPPSTVIQIQPTPLDEKARQMRELREATNDQPIFPFTLPPKRKIYLTRTEMETDLGGK